MSKPTLYLSVALCLCIGVLTGLLGTGALNAQSGGYTVAAVVASCGSMTYAANTFQPITMTTAGLICVNQ